MDQKDERIEDAGEKLRDEVSKTSESVKSEIQSASQAAGEAARQEAEVRYGEGKEVAEEHLDTLSGAIGEAAEQLEDENHPLASYANELSTQLGQLAGAIENKSLDDVASDAHRLARDNPALFMLGSVALGFAAARFIKASDSRDRSGGNHGSHDSRGATGYNDSNSPDMGKSNNAGRVAPGVAPASGYSSTTASQLPPMSAMSSTTETTSASVANNPGKTV